MGIARFLNECYKDGMYDMTYEEAKELRSAWFEAFPEMEYHMKPAECATPKQGGDSNIYEAHALCGLSRRYCSYNSACNYPLTCGGYKMG